ncbi:hypothetical protein V8E36_006213 [Tilletia maclaganii]
MTSTLAARTASSSSSHVLTATLPARLSNQASAPPRSRRQRTAARRSISTSSSSSQQQQQQAQAPPASQQTPTGDSEPYLKDLLQRSDRTSYLISHFFPSPHHRRPYLALRAFNAELAQIRDNVSNELLGTIRIGWWRDAVRSLYGTVENARSSKTRVPAHPVLHALHTALTDPALRALPTQGLLQSEHHLQALISAREDDLASPSTSPPTLDQLERYAERTASRLAYLELDLVGVADAQMDEVCSHLGKARGLVNVLASVPFHARMLRVAAKPGSAPVTAAAAPSTAQPRRLTLPQEYLLAHGVVEEEVYRKGSDAQGLRDAVFDTATRANDYLISARTALERADFPAPTKKGAIPDVLKPVLVGAVPALDFLRRLEKVNFDLFEPGLQQAGWRLSWELWRTSRSGRF